MAAQQSADMTNLLRWSIEHSNPTATGDSPSAPPPSQPATSLDQEALRRLILGGPSDADRMKDAMAAILSEDTSLADKEIAFDNFEQLVEGIDNANNMEPLGLWQPLVDQLASESAEMRMWAAWCLATAVSNNIKAQEKMFVLGAIPTLVRQATADSSPDARKKAILALSSGVRNHQPSLDKAVESIPREHLPAEKVSANDMDAIDGIMSSLRASSA